MTEIERHLKDFVAKQIAETYVGNDYGCIKELCWQKIQKELEDFFKEERNDLYDKDDSRGCDISSEI